MTFRFITVERKRHFQVQIRKNILERKDTRVSNLTTIQIYQQDLENMAIV
jgi:hypothetical protein